MADEKVVRLPCSADGSRTPRSPVYAASYPNPRWMYLCAFFFWVSISLFRWILVFKETYWILFYWNGIDCFLFLANMVWILHHVLRSHHRARYLGARPYGDIAAKDVVHVLCILHSSEPAEMLYDLVRDLHDLPCEGKKFLLIGMENSTLRLSPSGMERIAHIKKEYGDGFEKILYTVHSLQAGEIVGTGSNHFEAQIASEAYFSGSPNMSNVIFSKFDTNMRLDTHKKLLTEIEAVWCMVDRETRRGITFMPNVYWGDNKRDLQRSCMEKFVSFSMSTVLQQASFSMAFVSGSLEGVCATGYTPPSLLAEDDLTFSKKQALLPKPRTYRLSSCIMKVFNNPAKNPDSTSVERAQSNKEFTSNYLEKKMKRWIMGHVEKDWYFATWLFLPFSLPNFGDPHPRVKNRLRILLGIMVSVLRMYLIFVIPLNVYPFINVCWRLEFTKESFLWYRLVELLPDTDFSWGPGITWSLPYALNVTTGAADATSPNEQTWEILSYISIQTILMKHGHAFFLLCQYWCLTPAGLISAYIMLKIQRKIYTSFDFLEFNWRTSIIYCLIFIPVLLLLCPLFLLYCFIKHGCLNRPAGHAPMSQMKKPLLA